MCDGRTVNNRRTPDLRSRFVLGQGQGDGLAGRGVGQIGGAESSTLTEANFAAHRHVFDPPGAWADSGGQHSHSYQTHCVRGDGRGVAGNYVATRSDDTRSGSTGRSVSHGTHQHGLSFSVQSAVSGGGQPHPNMPPFYVLAYIMRVQ